jgi:hypothetical protein
MWIMHHYREEKSNHNAQMFELKKCKSGMFYLWQLIIKVMFQIMLQ